MSIDVSYLAKLQDYYARHNVIPSYATLGKLWGISAKSWVANYVNRFKEEGYLKLAPDRRLGPGPRFFERRLARVPVRAGLPEDEQEGGNGTGPGHGGSFRASVAPYSAAAGARRRHASSEHLAPVLPSPPFEDPS